jgi:putative addiction module killer protein
MNVTPKEIRFFESKPGHAPVLIWVRGLEPMMRIRVMRRLANMSLGNLGDVRALGQSLWEARIHTGPGYRIYYFHDGCTILLLLLAGEKSSQHRDIQKAREYLGIYLMSCP